MTVTPLVWLDGSGGGPVTAVDVGSRLKVVETPLSVVEKVERDRGTGRFGMARAWTALRQRASAAARRLGWEEPSLTATENCAEIEEPHDVARS